MFWKIAAFEFRYQLRNPIFWVTYGIFFLMSFGATTVDQIRIGSSGNVHKNAPFAILQVNAIMSLFAIFVLVAFVANVIVRDDETGYAPIIRSTRVKKFDYLIGRFMGAFGAAALSFTSVSTGILIGSFMPWLDSETVGPLVPGHYLFAYFLVALPTLFLTGAGFFAVATATRSMMATYLAVVGFLVAYLSAAIAADKPEYELIGAYIEPFGLAALSHATKYWTIVERNSQLPPIEGIILVNRLIWTGIATALLILAYYLFEFDNTRRTIGKLPKPPVLDFERSPTAAAAMPKPNFNGSTALAQFIATTRIDMNFVFRSPAFIVLLLIGLFNSVSGLWISDELYGNPAYPVTRATIETLRGTFTIIPIIIAIYYAGELVWRDRDRKMHEIIDSTPVPDWMFILPKITAVFLVLFATLLISIMAGMAVQMARGYYEFEISHYIFWYALPLSVSMLNIAILAMFAQALSPHKYVGWGVMAICLVASIVLVQLGFEHNLYRFNATPGVPLSDMNGQGKFWVARGWLQIYWTSFAAILALFTYGLWRRGTETRITPRLARLPARGRGLAGILLILFAAIFIGSGGYIFYNTNVENTYRSSIDREDLLAEMEKALIGFEKVPQPRIIDVVLDVDLDPHLTHAHTTGRYIVENRSGQPLDHIHIRWDTDLDMIRLNLDAAEIEQTYDRFNYRIYRLDMPMAPGERREISFETILKQTGFRNSGNQTRIVDNGTFLNNFEIAPIIGMSQESLLKDRVKRRKHGLSAELRPPKLEDDSARAKQAFGSNSDWVIADITVTTDADQTPIAPGLKTSDEIKDGKRRAHFKSDSPINNFFSIQSGRYAEARDNAGDIDLSVYYHPQHKFNVERMLAAMKTTFDVLPKAFSPYQFHQARIVEFPSYARFAQSFANTIPYSEAIGFIVNQDYDPDGIDAITFVTAHEIGHQWWAHQVMPADMQGATMLIETFAQYSALLVMEKLYGPEQVRKFLKYEVDTYLRSRGGEVVEELPLARVENQPYIHYRKGAAIMYFLKDQVGETAVNKAMQRLIEKFAFKPAPYPSTKDFLSLLREEAPGHDELITDLFERIVLYDVKVTKANSYPRDDGQFDVTVEVEAKKLIADGKGKETEVPLAEKFDVGLFTREPGKNDFTKADVITFNHLDLTSGRQSLTLVSPKAPTFAGVDPYNKRITRNTDTVISKVGAESGRMPVKLGQN